MARIEAGDAVKHHNYPIGKVVEIRTNLGNGRKHALVEVHGYPNDEPRQIPLDELTIDQPHQEQAA